MRAHGLGELQAANLTGFQRFSQAVFSQGSMFAGMMASHRLEEAVGLRAHVDGATAVTDTLASMVSLGVGSHLGHKVLGSRFATFQQEIGIRANIYTQGIGAPGGKTAPAGALGLAPALAGGRLGSAAMPQGLAMAMMGDRDGLAGKEGVSAMMMVGAPEQREPYRPLSNRYVVIGNRGEPAVRAVEEAKQLGATPVVYYSEADANSLHANMDGVIRLPLKGNTSNETYNNIPARMAALERFMKERQVSPERVIAWEGWGFKSEDSELFARYEAMGIRAAGANSKMMAMMGNKISARAVAERAGVPIVPGSGKLQSYEEALAFAKQVGFPVIIKGGDTGGGKGIRVALTEAALQDAYESAKREAFSTSGSDVVFAEKFISSMRHLEVQVIGDSKGNFKVVGVRDCTMQRNKQKVLEEDVSTFLPENLLRDAKQIGAKLMAQLRADDPRGIGYEGPGTIELIWDRADDRLYFMEMNTRLQVEHTVTEMVSRRNLLREQLLIGAGKELSFHDLKSEGHAIEARITSEDPYNKFTPSTGRIFHMKRPETTKDGRSIVRIDSGVEEGREIPSYYDSMIAKLIVWAPTRGEAVEALHKALGEFEILGVKTNIPFLRALTATREFREGSGYDTNFIEKTFLNSEAGKPRYADKSEAVVAAAVHTFLKNPAIQQKVDLKFGDQEYRAEVFETAPDRFLVRVGDATTEVGLTKTSDHLYSLEVGGRTYRTLIHGEPGRREVLIGGVSYEIGVGGEGALGAEFVKSPSPAAVLKVLKAVGDPVKVGDPVVVTEAMKMETTLTAEVDGTVESILVKPGQQVDKGKPLVKIQPEGSAKAGEDPRGAAADRWSLPPAPLATLAEGEGSNPEQRLEALGWLTRYFEGYTGPLETLRGILREIEPTSEAEPEYNREVEQWVRGLLHCYYTVEAVFQPAYQRQLNYFLKTGKVEDARFEGILKSALRLHGVDSLEASPARENAVKRLFQSHEQLEGKRELLGLILPWVPKYEMNSVRDDLNGVRGVFVDQAQTPFLTQVEETLARLRAKGDDREDLQVLEEDFRQVAGMNRSARNKAEGKLLGRTEVILPFLMGKAWDSNKKSAQWAMRLIQKRLYRNYYNFGAQLDAPSERMIVTRMEPKAGKGAKSLLVVTRRSLGENELDRDLDRALHQLKASRRKLNNGSDPVLEILLPERPGPERLREFVALANRKLGGQGVQRLTLIFGDPKGGDPDFRTYEPNAAGVFVENTLLRDIHPLHADTIGLSRWTKNFDLERQDFGLFHNVHAYRATQKGMDPADPKADRRHFAIGEHNGKLTYHRFEGDIVRNQLLQDFRQIRSGAATAGFSRESRLIWQWLPFALRESGQIGKDFDPFTVGVLTASPAELVAQFQLDEAKLSKAASVYDGKVFSVPEAERLAGNTALVMRRLQESNGSDGEARKLPALADLFFRVPVELSDEEIKLLAFRLTPQFMGQQLEKTTLHFKRRSSAHGTIESYIAEVKIPRGSRFEVNIKPAIEAPAHAVKTPLEHKRVQQQGRGKLYVYDRVHLFHDVLKDFYPQGHIPEDAVQIRELALDKSGQLVPVLRDIGQNDIGKVAFHVTLKLPLGTNGEHYSREFAIIADDFTFQAGSQGTKEGEIYRALSRYAEEKGIPKLYLAETSGARLGLAEEVTPFVFRDDGKQVNYVRAEDLDRPVGKKKRPLRDLVVLGEPYEESVPRDGQEAAELRYPVTAILGEGEINTESLNASGKTGESESRARSAVPTFTIAMGTVIGIGTYDTKLSERVIMVNDSFLGLTGRKAINQTFGTNLKDELEVAGPEIMKENGVAYKVVPGEREAMKGFLQWLSYLPAKAGAEAPRLEAGDSIDRDITPGLLTGDNPVIKGKGQPYDTRRFDAALFDRDSVFYVREGYGRAVNTGYARLGGRPVGFITMQLQPEQVPGGETIFGGALDAAASYKVSQHIDNLNLEGLPLLFNASISGFMPRPEDHLRGVVPGGAKILDSLRLFRHPALIYIPPYGQLWGGAWVVIDKNINPNIVMVADHTAAMGILGSAGAISVPKNERAMEADLKRHPELAALRAKLEAASGKEREGIELAYRQAVETLRVQHYLPKWRAILDAQNTAERAYRAGTIHGIIRDTAQTRPELFRLLQEKDEALRQLAAADQAKRAEREQISGALNLMGVQHDWSPEGAIEIRTNGVRLQVPPATLLKGLQAIFGGQKGRAFKSILEAGIAEGDGSGNNEGK
ncbi:MAG: carboxyl transferase domain-containing protein [bacterium]